MTSLYVHIPFCEHKCSYCDFYSIVQRDTTDAFIEALCNEIRMRGALLKDKKPIETVFFGGGTPSLLSSEQMKKIVEVLRTEFSYADNCEWTMEANPGTVTEESLKDFRSLGFNRLSFGVQSFNEPELKFLERIHSVEQVYKGVEFARKAGFENINVDLMFGVPGQTLDSVKHSIDCALSLNTEHISAYSLIYEEGTPLYNQLTRQEFEPLDEDLDATMYEYVMHRLAFAGFMQYEVSNYALPGRECKHNLAYWQSREYLAFGPSAHGYVNSTRYWNFRSLHRYLELLGNNTLPTLNQELLTADDIMFENIFLGLRSNGVLLRDFNARYAVDLVQHIKHNHPWMFDEGLVIADERLHLSSEGYLNCDSITLDLISSVEVAVQRDWRMVGPAEEPNFVEFSVPKL